MNRHTSIKITLAAVQATVPVPQARKSWRRVLALLIQNFFPFNMVRLYMFSHPSSLRRRDQFVSEYRSSVPKKVTEGLLLRSVVEIRAMVRKGSLRYQGSGPSIEDHRRYRIDREKNR